MKTGIDSWRQQNATEESKRPKSHIIALDMLGHGYTAKPPMDYTIGNYAARRLDRVSIIGQSLGGWVAA